MKKSLIIITLIITTGIFDIPILFESAPIVYTQNTSVSQKATVPQTNYVLSTIYSLFGFCVIWFIFYNVVYPRVLLRYYPPGYSQSLFW